MSWFGTLADPLQPDICGGGGVKNSSGESSEATANFSDVWEIKDDEPIEQESPKRRVKEDISELKNVLSSKFWGVASFLTPPSSSQTPTSSSSPRIYSSPRMQQEPTISGDSELVDSFESSGKAGIRSDFAEIGGTLKTGIARLSNNVAINGISKIAYNLLSLREDVKEDEEGDEVVVNEEFEDEPFTDVIGVTDEVLAFAGNIACHPETWLDFPLLSDDEDFLNDFDMSETQQDHALVIESLVPRLAALRIELCPTHMSIWCFWKIYFALLHPRLNKHDAELLSTPQIVEARALLQHGLQNQTKQESEDSRGHAAFKDVDYDPLISSDQFSAPGMLTKYWLSQGSLTSKSIKNLEMEKQSGLTSEAEFVDKFVVKEEPLQMKVKEVFLGNSGEDDDEWPVDETLDGNSAGMATILVCNEEDISFSDLEDSDRWSNFSKSSKSAAH